MDAHTPVTQSIEQQINESMYNSNQKDHTFVDKVLSVSWSEKK